MIPSKFDFVRAESVEHVVQLLQDSDGEGKIIAGGHSLLPLMKFRVTEPGKLIDISRIPSLKGVRVERDRVVVGAMMTHREVAEDPIIKEHIPVLSDAARLVGDIQIRNRGTIGGNIAHGDAIADLPAPALALDANLIICGEDGMDVINIDGFFLGPLITALPENSVVTSISFEIPPSHTKSAYLKYFHPATGYPVVGVAIVLGVNSDGLADYVRVGITGSGDVAYRAKSVEQELIGKPLTEDVIAHASKLAADDGDIGSDLFASESYRRNLCSVYTRRAISSLLI
jgi:aerobic carbon-monoxide dehydrogenase medium subunit